MTDTADIVQQIAQLRCEHSELDAAIACMAQEVWIDQLLLSRMKKRKLRIKDMIAWLESRLIPDLGA